MLTYILIDYSSGPIVYYSVLVTAQTNYMIGDYNNTIIVCTCMIACMEHGLEAGIIILVIV